MNGWPRITFRLSVPPQARDGAGRAVTIGNDGIVAKDVVTRGARLPAAARPPDGTLIPVTFRMSVPSIAPRDAMTRWVGGNKVGRAVAIAR